MFKFKALIAATLLGGFFIVVDPVVAAQPAAPVTPVWTGPYVGGQISGLFLNADQLYDMITPFHYNGSGVNGGLLAGYNFQNSEHLVFGIEGDISFGHVLVKGLCLTACDGSGADPKLHLKSLSTLRGRVGYAAGHSLFYGTAGIGLADVTVSDSLQGVNGGKDSHRHKGFVVGGGAEYGFNNNMSLRLDYLYGNYEATPYALVFTPDKIKFETHAIRTAINWYF